MKGVEGVGKRNRSWDMNSITDDRRPYKCRECWGDFTGAHYCEGKEAREGRTPPRTRAEDSSLSADKGGE